MSQWNGYYNTSTQTSLYPSIENNTNDQQHFNSLPVALLPDNYQNYYQQNNFNPNVGVYAPNVFWSSQLELNHFTQESSAVNVFDNNITLGSSSLSATETENCLHKIEPAAAEFKPHSNVSMESQKQNNCNISTENQNLVSTGAIKKNKQYSNYSKYQNNSNRCSKEFAKGHSSKSEILNFDHNRKRYYNRPYSKNNKTDDKEDKKEDKSDEISTYDTRKPTLELNSNKTQRKSTEETCQRYSNNPRNKFTNDHYQRKNSNSFNYNSSNNNSNGHYKSFNSFAYNNYNKNNKSKQTVYVNSNLNRFRNNTVNYKHNTTSSDERNSTKLIDNNIKKYNISAKSRKDKVEHFSSLREKLIEQSKKGIIECLVCCELVRQEHSIWSCQNCYHILHLNCIQKWATSSKVEGGGWRCPACQHVYLDIPDTYLCYCKKVSDPVYTPGRLPHSCGEVCNKTSKRSDCSHNCKLLCHPGPCPDCIVFVDRKCKCGATTQIVKCCSTISLTCNNICNNKLNCGVHQCKKKCHIKECSPCEEIVNQVCYCGKKKQQVPCTADTATSTLISCEEVCNKLLSCGNHTCSKICHDGPCEECSLSPEFVTTCYCGQTTLTEQQKRTSCLDPIPSCEKICKKKLKCGQPHAPHTCSSKCHPGECPPCDLTTLVRCRCGHMDREVPCKQLTGRADDARCEKRCTKKRLCGRHKCNKLCCIDVDHECNLPCNRMLSCGKHKCESTCHRGRCMPCLQSSFEELYCECGSNVLYPPIACGTKRPTCTNLCSRQHRCDHSVMHNCHDEPECPPCTVLTTKWCYGKHEQRKTIPCNQKSFSCGLPCGKDLPCKRHKCIAMCHEGECTVEGKICSQPCNIPRRGCSHPCGLPCHDGDCPNTLCKEMVKVTCQCGHRTAMRTCTEQSREYQRIAASMLVSKMKDVELGNSVDIKDVVDTNSVNKEAKLKILECNEECRIIERNRRLAIGLQIRNPDLSQKLTPRYSDFMKQWAKKDPYFCQKVHDKLTELVQLAKQSKQKSRSYSFETMNREKRQFVHEYCEHFGCESAAYDREPNRNVVATASRDKAWLPSYSLLEVVQRQSGHRKVPGPMLSRTSDKLFNSQVSNTSALTSLPLVSRDTATREDSSTTAAAVSNALESDKTLENIDYFDNPPE